MKIKFKIITFISTFVFLISSLSLIGFADNSNFYIYDTPSQQRLCGIPFFSANTNFGDFSNYIINNLGGQDNRICQIFAVKYYNGRVYIPLNDNSVNGDNIPLQFSIHTSGTFIYQNSTFYRYFGYATTGDSVPVVDRAQIVPNDYALAQSLFAYNDSNSLYMGIKCPMNKNSNGFVYITSANSIAVNKFAYINDNGVIDYADGSVLGDDLFNSSSDSLGWCAIFRNFSGSNYKASLYDLLSVFNIFGENTGFTNGNDSSVPQAIFPRYPSSALDNSGFYYDDLSTFPLSFYVKDYGNKHKYSLLIRSTHIKSDRSTYRTDFGGSFLPPYTWVNDELLSTYNDSSPNVQNCKNLLNKWKSNSLIFDNIMTIHFPCLDFSRVDNGARATSCSFNLSSFVKGEDTQFFIFYVIDETSSDCVGSCAVLTSKGFGYTPSSYPVKSYSWSSDSFDSDLPTGNNFVGHNDYSGSSNGLCYTPTISSDGVALTGNSKYYDGSDFDYSDYNNNDINFNVDISSLTNTFGTALDSTRQFFTLCVGLIPPAIIAFIFGTLALIVILRILGR